MAGTVSVGAHALILLALVSARIPPKALDPEPIAVALVAPPPPPPPPPKAAPEPAPAAPPVPTKSPPRSHLKPTPKPPLDVEPLPASEVPTPAPVYGLGEAELAGATTAGSGGGGGGGCNMVRLLQEALRKNPRVGAALARAHPDTVAAGKAIMIWNGDWVRNPGQDGKGLAGLRQAIALEIAFAPEPCRADPVHGLVLISLNDGPRSVRLALGAGQWRWSDLVFAQAARPS